MSSLPQRKKSAEEIAKLRERFGFPTAAPEGGQPSPAAVDNLPARDADEAPVPAPPVAPNQNIELERDERGRLSLKLTEDTAAAGH